MGAVVFPIHGFRTDDRQDRPDGRQGYFRLRQEDRQQCCQPQPRDRLAGSASLSALAGKGYAPMTTGIYKQYEEHSYAIDFLGIKQKIFNTPVS